MAWKLRKDKLKAGTPGGEETVTAETDAGSSHGGPEQSDETEQSSVFDLSGSAFQPETTDTPGDEPEVPTFLDHDQSATQSADPVLVEQPHLEPIALEPLATEQVSTETVSEPSFLTDPLPEHDPIVMPSPTLEPEMIAFAPIALTPETVAPVQPAGTETNDTAAETLNISPVREAIAPGLVSMETETGLPKVAPFILDTPTTPISPAEPRMHSVVIRIGKLSATHFLTKDVTTIGRPDSIIQNYPDIEIELDDGVSRRHAEIRHTRSEYTLADVGSTNGTLLNGEQLTPHNPVSLQPGDRIRIGEITELLFE